MTTRHRSLEEIESRAAWELIGNRSITKYIFIDGVEYRSPGDPLIGMRESLQEIVKGLEGMVESAHRLEQDMHYFRKASDD